MKLDENKLWNLDIDSDNYPSTSLYQSHLIDQYKMYVEMADRISTRRSSANNFFLTLNTAMLSVHSLLYAGFSELTENSVLIFPVIAFVAVCVVWWVILYSYRRLNRIKYQVIGLFEEKLPASPYWKAEWDSLNEKSRFALYIPLSYIEQSIPVIFAILYILLYSVLMEHGIPSTH